MSQLNNLIYSYLKNLENNPGSGYDKAALSLAVSCVADALHVDETIPASEILESIFTEGLKGVKIPPELSISTEVNSELIAKAEELKNEGNDLFKSLNFNGAISKFTDSIKLNPLAATYSNRSLCYIKINKLDKAEEDARSAIRLDNKFARGYLRLSTVLEAQGRYQEAAEVLRNLTTFAPEYKRDLEEMEAKAQPKAKSSSPSSGSPLPSGGSGLPNIPGMEGLLKDPEIQELMMNPKFAKMAEEIKTGGIGSVGKYMSDPEIAPIMQKITSKLLGGGGGAGAFANMFGNGGHI
eukprot:gnl/Chilomastix_caulleri/1102.p1 GENE.gnl/Chilomastix_caulleri/1102~~gnl/Chilomastix_caulleri/1102.p1  ORF type:complete len:295 (-),score=101.60 gnl/Chilomastix_caulleri/1102:72-956(-)